MDSFSEDRKYRKSSQIYTQVFWKSSPQAPTVRATQVLKASFLMTGIFQKLLMSSILARQPHWESLEKQI